MKKTILFVLLILSFLHTSTIVAQSFISIWDTERLGTSTDSEIIIPTNPAFTYNYDVNWGDGNTDTGVNGNITHTYATPGIYTIAISGDFPAIYFNNTDDRLKIIEITSWGNIQWQSMENAFFGCENLNFDAITAPDLSQVTSLKNMFRNAISFNGILNNWDVSSITDISGMFQNAQIFNRPLDNWNTSAITDMSDTFNDARLFNEPLDNWQTGAVTTMARMFRFAFDFNQNISNWNVGNVTTMEEMFFIAPITFPLNSWNVSNVTNMDGMFSNTPYDSPLDMWDVSNVTTMAGMFRNARFNQNIENWNVSNVTNMRQMFSSNNTFNQPLNGWDVSSVTDMSSMFSGFVSTLTLFNQPLDQWDVSNVTNMSQMFSSCVFNQSINNWNVSNVNDMTEMFDRAENFNQPLDLWDVSNVTNMREMFSQAFSFNQPLNNWNIASATNMEAMFRRASVFNQLLDNWNTSNITNMRNMFSEASMFDQDLAVWNITGATNLLGMLDNSGLSETNYDNTLIGWAAQAVNTDITLGAATLKYCDGRFARQDLIDNFNWTILDDVIDCDFVLCNEIISPVNGDTNVPADFNLVWEEVNVATGYRLTVQKDTGGVITTILDNEDVGNITIYDFPVDFAPGDIVFVTVVPFNAEGPATGCVEESFTIVAPWNNSPEAFQLTYDTSIVNASSTPANQLRIGSTNGFAYNYSIDWGDNQFDNNVDDNITHTYETPGIYTISIIGDYPSHAGNIGTNDNDKLMTIDQWGTIEWLSMRRAFRNCENMTYNATDVPDLTQVTDMSEMFEDAELFNGNINNWDVSNVTNMTQLFAEASVFNQPLNNWDVSNVTNMAEMFERAELFNQNINDWDVSSVTNMRRMFDGFVANMAFNQPLNNWDVSNVTDMSTMFRRTISFDQPLDNWDVSNVTSMAFMFNSSAFNQNINNWMVDNVTNMSSMFNNTPNFNQPLDSWNVSAVITMASMFQNTEVFDQNINNWVVSSVEDMQSMFRNAEVFNQPLDNWDVSAVRNTSSMFENTVLFNQNINNWNVSNVLTMQSMFQNAITFDQPLESWDVNSVVNMSSMFQNAQVFNQPINTWDVSAVATMVSMFQNAQLFDQPIDNWNVSSVTLMNSMFEEAQVFNQNINTWNVASVTNMQEMFKGTTIFNQPLENWNTGEVLTMEEMFRNATAFNQELNLWDVSFVRNMEGMFQNASAFNQPLSIWNVASVTTMERMFRDAIAFNQIINDWNTRAVTTMEEMFDNAIAFNEPLNDWRVANVIDMERMFRDAIAFNQNLDQWDLGSVSMRSMFQDASAFNQYLGDWNISGVNSMNNMLDNTALSRMNYDNTLIAWSEQIVTPGITFGALTLPYCDAFEEREDIIATYGWNIIGDVLDCPIPVCTQLTSPLNGDIDVPVNTNLNWEPAIFARGYRLTVTSVPANANNVTNITIINNTTYNFINDFNGGETVTVTIIPFNDTGDAIGCSAETFTIVNDPVPTLPDCTSLTMPVNGAMDVAVDTDLTWTPVSNADGYFISIGTTMGGTDITNNLDVNNTTVYDLPANLPENSTIYVTIIPYNAEGNAIGCFEESFETEIIPTAPVCTTLTMPLDNAVDVSLTTNLTWNAIANATGYILNVGTTSGGVEIVNNEVLGNVTMYDFPMDLPEDRTIYVTLIPFNDIGDAMGCNEESFTTEQPSNVMPVCTDFTANLDANGTVTITPNDIDGGSSDPDGPVTLSIDIDTFTCANLGPNIVTLTVTDNENNTGSCQATVTIVDNINPTIMCPENQTAQVDVACMFTIPDYTALATVNDNCSTPLVTQTPAVGTLVSTGTTIITLTATSGPNTVSCSFDLLVEDTIPPTINCPANQNETADANCQFMLPDYTGLGNAFDVCDNTALTITQDPVAGTLINGTTTIVLSASDSQGNTATCSFEVLLNDTTPPTLFCPADITESIDDNCQFTIPDYTNLATASDNCGTVTITQNPPAGTIIGLGTTQITLTASDGANMSTPCIFNVTVQDTTAPVANCVPPFSINLDANGMASITVADIDNGTTDNCSIANTFIDITSFNCDSLGENIVTLTVVDINGNEDSCTTTITIQDPLFACNATPVALCQPLLLEANENCIANAVAIDFDNGSFDPDGNDLTYNIFPEGPYPLGITMVTLTVNDGILTAECQTTITVNDVTPPTISCPENLVENANDSCSFMLPDYTELAIATDNCNIVTISQSPAIGSFVNTGETEITLTANDGTNTTSCSFTVTVVDNIPPTVLCQNITMTVNNTGFVQITPEDIDAGSFDNCEIASVTLDNTFFTCENLGENTVTLTVTDTAGNSSTCTAIVTIENDVIPEAICQNITVVLNENGVATITPDNIYGGADATCAASNLSIDIDTFTCEQAGTMIPVTLTATAANGTTDSCIALVNVVDNVPPNISCPTETLIIAAQDPFVLPDYVSTGEVTINDNCITQVVYEQSPAAGTEVLEGETVITVTAMDPSGNTTTCQFTIFVDPSLEVVSQQELLTSLTVFPNPADQEITLHNPNNIRLNKASLMDVSGRLLQTINLSDMDTIQIINISQLASASYFLVVENNVTKQTFQIIKK